MSLHGLVQALGGLRDDDFDVIRCMLPFHDTLMLMKVSDRNRPQFKVDEDAFWVAHSSPSALGALVPQAVQPICFAFNY
jgi:hypothetical protein